MVKHFMIMIQSTSIISSNSNSQLFYNESIFDILTVILICTLLVWYAQYHWKRRRLYRLAAKAKGPLSLPIIGNVLYMLGSTSADSLNLVLRFTTEYESPVRIWLGQRLYYAVWGAKDLQIILNSPHVFQKEDLYKFIADVIGTGIMTAPVGKWKNHRKIILPTFNQKILDGFVEVFSEESEVCLEQLEKEGGKGTFDIINYVSRYTLDIICETAMGVKVNAQTTESDYAKWTHRFKDIVFTRVTHVLYHYDFIFNRLSMGRELHALTKKINGFTETVIREKRKSYQKILAENTERPEVPITDELRKRNTFLQQLIELSEKGACLTDEELRDEVNIFIIAGTDTTAATISFTFLMLGIFPDIQDKVYKEVTDVLGADRAVEHTDLGKLQYLERVIKETMRLYPVGACVGRTATEDIKLETCTVPAGSSVYVIIYGVNRDPKIWPNPSKFDPDRFLPEEVAKRHPYSWLPFSGGPRNCIGSKYALMSMKTLIAMVIRRYRFHSDYKCIEDIKLKADLAINPVDGYKVSIEPRG